MVAPILYAAGAVGSVAASVALEFVFSGGKADRRDYYVAGAIGAIPGGYAFKYVPKTLQKARAIPRLGYYSRRAQRGKTYKYYGHTYGTGGKMSHADVYWNRKDFYTDAVLAFTPEYAMIASGYATGYASGRLYDMHMSMPQVASSAGPQVVTQSQLGSGRTNTSQPSRKPARVGKIGRRRKRCIHRDSRGRRCLRPAGHSGRHRYV